MIEKEQKKKMPEILKDNAYRYDAFENGKVLLNKRKNRLPAMGWNSWNAFGSGNTQALTMEMADAMTALDLDKLGYQYIVLDDGCYQPVRVQGKLSADPDKFPDGFQSLSDYIHQKGLKFGMYNDIGTNLCAGAAVGTWGYEDVDAQSYLSWDVDFIKVDNCYYLFDDATFSDKTNARYVYAPDIRSITVSKGDFAISMQAAKEGILLGKGAFVKKDYVTGIGTIDGTGPEMSPLGRTSSELAFRIMAPATGTYELTVDYAAGERIGTGSWLQVAVGEGEKSQVFYDDFLLAAQSGETFCTSKPIFITLQKGENLLRLMNHRRQENTLNSYATFFKELQKTERGKDIVFSICEWGKTQPQNWGYKVGDSWRILNDITFQVGADGDYGRGCWADDYTASVTSQYNKAVIMDEFAGLDKGWNDPDMLMVGMNGMTEIMSKTHMTMWCMMNAPLMLGLDLRRVKKGDVLWNMIANRDVIALNQDALGIPAKRVYSSLSKEAPDKEYIRDINRVDILAKPLSDGSLALSFINVSETQVAEQISITLEEILRRLGRKSQWVQDMKNAHCFRITDLWSKEAWVQTEAIFTAVCLKPCENLTIKITVVAE